jgi:hypothetical protein
MHYRKTNKVFWSHRTDELTRHMALKFVGCTWLMNLSVVKPLACMANT